MPDPQPLAQTVRDYPDITETLAEEEHASVERTPSLYRVPLTDGAKVPDGRYAVGERRGSGATGSVYVAQDNDLGRVVAIKVLGSPKGIDRFTREARIAAGLEHPNIVPVYDLDRTTDGRLCFTMRLVEGRSLGDAIRAPRGTTSYHEWIRVIRKVCDALSYAHHQGILHQDVKPDNILLGRFGAVLLVDWGAANRIDDIRAGSRIVGTPVYLAPEIARGEAASVASDVYSLGATLFHLLLGRYPMWEDDAEVFWERKRSGGLDLPNVSERRHIPAALLAIILHALNRDPAHRYRSIAAMASDLDRFQSGLSVSVYQDSLIERCSRWHHRHARGFWAAVLVFAVLGTAGWVLYGEWLKGLATWGRPVLAEDFEDESEWQKYWRTTEGNFVVRDGGLVSTGARANFAYVNRRMEGATAIEYQGLMLPDQPPCDLSVVYSLEDPFASSAPKRFLLQVGANDNSYAQIIDPAGRRVASNPLMLVPGRPYHIRMEIDGELLRILVDGRIICEHRELIPQTSGWIGVYAFYPGKVFDDLNLYTKGMPQKVTALAVGDQYCLDGMWDKAAAYYGRVAAVHGDKPIGEEAAYRCGYALRRAGLPREAEAVWLPIANGRWQGRIRLHGFEDLLERQAYAEIAIGIASIYPAADADLRHRLEALWAEAVKRAAVLDGALIADVESLLAVREHCFPDRGAGGAATALFALGDYEGVVRRFPEQVSIAAEALLRLGRPEEVLARYADRRFQVGVTYAAMGRIDDLRAMQPPMLWLIDYVEKEHQEPLTDFDREAAIQVLEEAHGSLQQRISDACRLDRIADAMRLCEEPSIKASSEVIAAYLLANRPEALVARFPDWTLAQALADYHQAISGFMAGEPIRAITVEEPRTGWFGDRQLWFARLLITPFLAELTGETGAMDAALARIVEQHRWHFNQAPWHCAEYLAGRIDEEAFLAQPYRRNAPPLLLICQGLRADRAGEVAAAWAAYAEFLALPAHLRCLHGTTRDPVVELFVQWRLQALSSESPVDQ